MDRRRALALGCSLSLLLLFLPSCGDKSGSRRGATEVGTPLPDGSSALASWRPGAHGDWTTVPLAAAGAERLNVILLTLDTTRPDRFHSYGYPEAVTPVFDKLASEGVQFDQARTSVPVTLPAHTSILTGLYPFQHGVRNNGTFVAPERLRTMAELLKEQGYATGAILGAFPVDHRFGLNQGFDHYDDAFPVSSVRRESDTAQRIAGDVSRLSLEWIDSIAQHAGPNSGNGAGSGAGSRGEKPFFLWAHYFDPHFPYAPPEPFRTRFAADPYEGEIAYMDAEVGHLIDGLAARGLLEKSIIVALADHGESLGEHDEMTHSIFIYNSTQHIPLWIRLPNAGVFAAPAYRGAKIASLVSHVDVLPTVWNALGLARETLPPVAGMSLLPVIAAAAPGHDWVYHETKVPELEYGASDLRALESSAFKYIRAPRPELYDERTDPKELNDLSARETKRVKGYEGDLGALLLGDAGASAQVTMDAETIEKLRSLGYLAGASAPAKHEGPPVDPKDMIWAYEAINAARNKTSEHRPAEALAIVDSVLKRYPNDETAKRIRASCLMRLNRGPEAKAAYDTLLADCQGCADELTLLRNRALAALAAGDLDDAEARIDGLLSTHPKEPGFHLMHSQLLSARGKYDEAAEAIRAELALYPDDTNAWVSLGDLERSRNRQDAAEKAYREALKRNAYLAPALAALSEILSKSGREAAARGMVEQALAADPSHPGTQFRKAYFLAQDGKFDQAAALYQSALASDPENPVGLYNLGNVYRKLGRYPQAVECYARALRGGRAPIEVYVNFGLSLIEMRKTAEGIKIWEDAVLRFPSDPSVPRIRENIERAQADLKSRGMSPQ